jgi:hypothetical protein
MMEPFVRAIASRGVSTTCSIQPQLVMECTGYQRVGFIRVEASAKVR